MVYVDVEYEYMVHSAFVDVRAQGTAALAPPIIIYTYTHTHSSFIHTHTHIHVIQIHTQYYSGHCVLTLYM